MKKVLIATPTLDGRLDVWYTISLIDTLRHPSSIDYELHPIFFSYDSLIQRSRNAAVKIALENDFDYLFFADSDVEWNPNDFYKLLEYKEDIVGGVLVKKNLEVEDYTVKILEQKLKFDDSLSLIEVDGVGTGFLKLSKRALQILWEVSPEYTSEEETFRLIFNVGIDDDGTLISEDFYLCKKWNALGEKVWIDPKINCNHVGPIKFFGNFQDYLDKTNFK